MTAARHEPFVPLTPSASTSAAKEFRATVVSRPAEALPLRALETTSSSPAEKKPTARTGAGEPRVSVQREEDQVSGIRIECACGQVIDLACVYQQPPKSA